MKCFKQNDHITLFTNGVMPVVIKLQTVTNVESDLIVTKNSLGTYKLIKKNPVLEILSTLVCLGALLVAKVYSAEKYLEKPFRFKCI